MEAPFNGSTHQDFMLLDFIDLNVDIDCTKGKTHTRFKFLFNIYNIIQEYDLVNADISNLDNGRYLDIDNENGVDNPETTHLMYDGISGGIVSMTVMKMGLKFKPCKVILLSI